MVDKKRKQLNALKQEINHVRHLLQTSWNTRGYTDAEVLKLSIELDLLINKYQQLVDQKPKQNTD
ncbi:MAG: aspartyl-phosphate phosphatase Spo0E family protein [Firmicutes bacterium]|nr:aspartyl-phosphate phosphatase Spo0E family protein [Bacillota bacterium]